MHASETLSASVLEGSHQSNTFVCDCLRGHSVLKCEDKAKKHKELTLHWWLSMIREWLYFDNCHIECTALVLVFLIAVLHYFRMWISQLLSSFILAECKKAVQEKRDTMTYWHLQRCSSFSFLNCFLKWKFKKDISFFTYLE